jgi:hypothetical protein
MYGVLFAILLLLIIALIDSDKYNSDFTKLAGTSKLAFCLAYFGVTHAQDRSF